MSELIIQGVGWLGTFLVVLAYYLVSTKKVDGNSKAYQWMNLLGAIGIGINVYHQEAWPSFTLQIVWGGVAIAGLLRRR